MKITRQSHGFSYISILMVLIAIEFIALTMLSSISTTSQAAEYTNKTIVANRIAETCLENAIYQTKLNFDSVIETTPQGDVLSCNTRKGYEVYVSTSIYSDGTTTYSNLKLIEVKTVFHLSSLVGKSEQKEVKIKRLVMKDV